MARAHVNEHLREASPPKFHFLHFEVFYLHVKINKSRWSACIRQMRKSGVFSGSRRWQGELFKCFWATWHKVEMEQIAQLKSIFFCFFLACVYSVSRTRLIAGCTCARSARSLFGCEPSVFAKSRGVIFHTSAQGCAFVWLEKFSLHLWSKSVPPVLAPMVHGKSRRISDLQRGFQRELM